MEYVAELAGLPEPGADVLRLKGAGLIAYFGSRDVTTIRPGEINTYLQWLQTQRGRELTPSTLNKYVNAFRKTLNIAVEEGILPGVTSNHERPSPGQPATLLHL